MVLNEGFVIMRHVHPWFANKRDQLIAKHGSKWKKFHATLDYVWIGGVSIGILIDFSNWKGELNTIQKRIDGKRQIWIQDPQGYWIEINDIHSRINIQ